MIVYQIKIERYLILILLTCLFKFHSICVGERKEENNMSPDAVIIKALDFFPSIFISFFFFD